MNVNIWKTRQTVHLKLCFFFLLLAFLFALKVSGENLSYTALK